MDSTYEPKVTGTGWTNAILQEETHPKGGPPGVNAPTKTDKSRVCLTLGLLAAYRRSVKAKNETRKEKMQKKEANRVVIYS